MIKRVVVTGLKARGYVDGRYVGEEKKESAGGRDDPRGGKRRGKAGAGKGQSKGQGRGQGKGFAKKRDASQSILTGEPVGNGLGNKRGRRGTGRGASAQTAGAVTGVPLPSTSARGHGRGTANGPRGQPRKNRAGKKTPFRPQVVNTQNPLSPSETPDLRRVGEEVKSGQFAEALAAQANVKRERLHKVLAQSGHGSRRDMEIMISSGRVMVNGIVATTGTQVSPGDNVMVDHRPVKIKFSEELPRVLLYHKPEGEIVTTSDPGNRITVFDNLPKVENGKWIAIGRLDINTSGLLIFTTSGELANRFMHPRYEVEREYAVRILGELTETQTQALLTGVNIDFDADEDEEVEFEEPSTPARFDTIEKREGESSDGANQWYHVTIKEGRNREVRKMFESQGLTVSRLIRTRFGSIDLPPRLGRGMLMELAPDQIRRIVTEAGMADDFPMEARPAKRPRGRGREVPGHDTRAKLPQPPQSPRKPRGGHARSADANAIPVVAGAEVESIVVDAVDGAVSGTVGGAAGERENTGRRQRRNRRGGKNARRAAAPGVEGGLPAGNVGHERHVDYDSAGNRQTAVGDAANVGADDGGNDGSAIEGHANTMDPAQRGARPPGAGQKRGRPRRNFRGRNGRKPRNDASGAAGSEGGGNMAGDGGGNVSRNDSGNRGNDGGNRGNDNGSNGAGNDGGGNRRDGNRENGGDGGGNEGNH